MFTVHQLSKRFDLDPLFENVTFSVNAGDRVGLVGPNGCGKTTLLRIIAGELPADAGHVSAPTGLRIGYLRQGAELDPRAPVVDLLGRAGATVDALEALVADAATRLARVPDDAVAQQTYDRLLVRLATADPGRLAAVTTALGLDQLAPGLTVGQLSGGQKTRLQLALVLLQEPDVLLLDEPTNHLDIGMLEWLESWLRSFPGGVLLVSHDRTFLDRAVTRILALDPRRRSSAEYAGGYSDYEAQRAAAEAQQWAAYQDQQAEIQRLQADIARVKAQASHTERQASSVRIGGEMMKLKGYKDYQQSIARKVARKAKAREKKLERYLDDGERVEKPRAARSIRLDFDGTRHLGRDVVALTRLAVGYDPARPLLQGVTLTAGSGGRIVITGPNGAGKTSLLRTIAGELPPLAGTVRLGVSVQVGVMSQEQDNLAPARSGLETIQPYFSTATAARRFLGYFLLVGDEPLKPVAQLSYGQRSRLALARLVAGGCNLLLLDEPINHLDIPSRIQFEEALTGFEGTILAVIHDRAFIDRFAEEVWWVEEGRVRRDLRR